MKEKKQRYQVSSKPRYYLTTEATPLVPIHPKAFYEIEDARDALSLYGSESIVSGISWLIKRKPAVAKKLMAEATPPTITVRVGHSDEVIQLALKVITMRNNGTSVKEVSEAVGRCVNYVQTLTRIGRTLLEAKASNQGQP